MRKFLYIVFILVFLIPPDMSVTFAQVVEVSAKLDSTRIKIGEQVKLHLEIKKDLNTKIRLEEYRDSLCSGIELIGSPELDSISFDNKQVINHIYNLTSFDSGFHTVPAIPVYFKFNNIIDTIYSSPILLEVYSPAVDTTKAIKDIKAPINAPLTFREIIPYIGIGAGILLFAAIIVYLFFRFKKKKPVFAKPAIVLPAHVVAFAELDRLKDEKLWQSGKVKEFYVRLSDIIRIYLENRYGFNAMELVTGEIVSEFKKSEKEIESIQMLSGILQTSDMVKFAKGDPLPADNQLNMDNSYLLVEKTKFIEIVPVDELVNRNASVEKPDQKAIV
jgi:hypothetical protein